MNRLLSFSVRGVELHVSIDGTGQTAAQVYSGTVEDKFAVSLMLDLNNVPDRGTLSADNQKTLFTFYESEFRRLIESKSPAARLWEEVK